MTAGAGNDTAPKRKQSSRSSHAAGHDAEVPGKTQDNPKIENRDGEVFGELQGVAKTENAGAEVEVEVEVPGDSPDFENTEGNRNETGAEPGHEQNVDGKRDAGQYQDPMERGISSSPPGIDDALAAFAAFAKAATGVVVGQELPQVAANDGDTGGSCHAQKR